MCLSACVNLLVAGSEKSVAEGSLILTHHTSYAMEDWAKLSDFKNENSAEFASAFTAKVTPIAERYEGVFDPLYLRYLSRSFQLMRPACVKIDYDSGRVFAATRMQWILPNAAVLAQLGIDHPDDWPGNATEAHTYLSGFSVAQSRVETSRLDFMRDSSIVRKMRECIE